MKKSWRICLTLVSLLLLLVLMSSCMLLDMITEKECDHTDISEATCQQLATCNACGQTVGDYAPHSYIDARYLGNDDYLRSCENCNFEYAFKLREGNSHYGYYQFSEYENGDDLQLLYEALICSAEELLLSGEDITDIDGYYVIGRFDTEDYSLTLAEAMAVWKVFYVSSPVYYWLDATCVTRGDILYLAISPAYASADYRAQCDVAIDEMTEECSALLTYDMSELERAMTVVEYIVTNISYAYEADGVTPTNEYWAHNMTGLAKYGSVCEAYAKSFLYLCLLNDVECIISTGYSYGIQHAWNYVKIDGLWYGADITWTDKCDDAVVYDDFGLSSDAFFADHISHSSDTLNVEYIYESPALADSTMAISVLYKNGVKVGAYKSLSDALAYVTDRNAEYEIDISRYSPYENDIAHVFKSSIAPRSRKLTIIGSSEYVGEDYIDTNTLLYLSSDLTLSCDLELRDVMLISYADGESYTVDLSSYDLTLSGESVYLDCRITGRNPGSEVICDALRGVYFFAGADVNRLSVIGGKAVFGAESFIFVVSGDELYAQGDVKVTIVNRE